MNATNTKTEETPKKAAPVDCAAAGLPNAKPAEPAKREPLSPAAERTAAWAIGREAYLISGANGSVSYAVSILHTAAEHALLYGFSDSLRAAVADARKAIAALSAEVDYIAGMAEIFDRPVPSCLGEEAAKRERMIWTAKDKGWDHAHACAHGDAEKAAATAENTTAAVA